MTSEPTPRQYLEYILKVIRAATSGQEVIWNALVAIDATFALLESGTADWRSGNDELLEVLPREISDLAPMLADQLSERVDQDDVFYGMGSVATLLGALPIDFPMERVPYARILRCRLAIVLDEDTIARQGHRLRQVVSARIDLAAVKSPSAATH